MPPIASATHVAASTSPALTWLEQLVLRARRALQREQRLAGEVLAHARADEQRDDPAHEKQHEADDDRQDLVAHERTQRDPEQAAEHDPRPDAEVDVDREVAVDGHVAAREDRQAEPRVDRDEQERRHDPHDEPDRELRGDHHPALGRDDERVVRGPVAVLVRREQRAEREDEDRRQRRADEQGGGVARLEILDVREPGQQAGGEPLDEEHRAEDHPRRRDRDELQPLRAQDLHRTLPLSPVSSRKRSSSVAIARVSSNTGIPFSAAIVPTSSSEMP